MKKPTVSVVIPNWHGRQVIGDCLKSLQSQTYKPLEIIVVENGHTDNSPEIIKTNFPKVKIIQLEKNIGFAAAVNVGIKAAVADYIWLFNNDANAKKDCLEQLVKTASKKNADIVSSVILTDDGKKIDSDGDVYTVYGLPFPQHRGLSSKAVSQQDQQIFSASGGASLYKKSLFSEIGYFDERFFAYYEDVDLCMRAQLQKKSIWLSHSAIVEHAMNYSSNKVPGFGREMAIRNSIYLFWKNLPAILLIKMLPKFVYSNARLTFAAIKKGYFTKAFKAHLIALLHIFSTLLKRHRIQSKRMLNSKEFQQLLSPENPFKVLKQRQ